MRYYWCVNCGYSHDYGKDKKRGVGSCVNCGYDDVTELEEDEWDIERVTLRNKSILKDGKTFVDQKPKMSKEEIDDVLKQIREGKYVNSNG